MRELPELTAEEIRVLGCLVEKAAMTPDNYPLSTNALMAACNQTTNREPVMEYAERAVDAALLDLRQRGLARTVRGDGQRVHKHRHVVDEAWSLDGPQLSVLSVLMLRGAQTAAELRTRTARYGTAADDVEPALRELSSGGFVRQLARRPGERETRWAHLLGGAIPDASVTEAADGPLPARASTLDRVDALEQQVAELSTRLEEVATRVATLMRQLGG